MSLTSGISKRYKQLFILDDDGIRRIEGVLTKASTTYSEPLKITYHVEREDDRFFETHDIADVLADPNVKDKRIKLVGIELRKESSLELAGPKEADGVAWIVFNKDEPPFQTPDVRIKVSSPDKTWALMLADELDPQISRLFKIKPFPSWIFLLFAPMFGLIFYRLSLYLGFLNPKTLIHGILSTILFILVLWGIRLYNHVSEDRLWISKFFHSEPVFLWGDELSTFHEKENLKKNIFWGVIVAFIISVLASLFTLLI